MSLPVRLFRTTEPPRTWAMARKPSSFGSNIQPGWEKGRSTSRACIGFSESGNGAGLPRAGPAGEGSRPCFRSSTVRPE